MGLLPGGATLARAYGGHFVGRVRFQPPPGILPGGATLARAYGLAFCRPGKASAATRHNARRRYACTGLRVGHFVGPVRLQPPPGITPDGATLARAYGGHFVGRVRLQPPPGILPGGASLARAYGGHFVGRVRLQPPPGETPGGGFTFTRHASP